MTNNTLQALFVVFAFFIQVLLIINFAARNWKPSLERKHGWLLYAMVGILGLILGILFLAGDQPWYIVAAPLVSSIWAVFGYYVDTYRQISWRSPPRWPVFIPYVALFMASQFFFWIPLWYIGLEYWIAYSAMYFINTALNIYGSLGFRGATVSDSPTCWGCGAANPNKLGSPARYPRQLPKTHIYSHRKSES